MLAVAHRGYSSAYPENTALAFERAIEAGADFIETDVRLTRDGRLVCWHDPDLQRTAGANHLISDLSLDELQAVRLRQRQRILALDEGLAIARGRVGVMLDVKIPTEQMIETMIPLLRAARMTQDVVYGARAVEHLAAVRRKSPGIALLGMPADPSLAGDYLKHDVRGLRYWEDEVTVECIRHMRDADREVWVTAGLRKQGEPPGYATVERIAALMRMGVSAVLVNDPKLVNLARARRTGKHHAEG